MSEINAVYDGQRVTMNQNNDVYKVFCQSMSGKSDWMDVAELYMQ